MLSAVENNSRAYNVHHHLAYGGGVSNGPSPSITAGTGLNTYPTNGVPAAGGEFAKPHPKLSRYSSLPSRSSSGSSGSPGGSNILPPSPVTNASPKFKYSSAMEQPVNLAMSGSPVNSASSPGSSPQQSSLQPGIDKLKNEYDLLKATGLQLGNFGDFLYSRHAAAAAASFLSPQPYPPLMYTQAGPAGPPPPSLYSDPARRSLSPGKNSVASLGRSNSDSLAAFHHLQRSPGQVPNGLSYGGHLGQQQQQQQQQPHQSPLQNQQKGLKGPSAGQNNGSAGGFMLPPPMMPTQAELEAYHAYHQGAAAAAVAAAEMGSRLYYNGHGPPPEHLMSAQQQQQRMHSSQQQQPNLPPPPSPLMSRSQQQHAGKRAIHGDAGMYQQQQQLHLQQQQHHNHRQGQPNGGGGGGEMVRGVGKGAANHQQDKNNNIGFKVPSGKEGSMKHRLLTTRTKERKTKGQQNGKNLNNNSSYGTSNIIKSNFNKGVLIELGNGELKPVEEMRTEDFILSSNVTPDLEMIDSTVLRIMPHGNSVVLTLSNSASKLNIDLTVAPEHPFFVYRQGWASCHPDGTYHMHGLKCQRLEVGDVCISLMQKERHALSHQESAAAVAIEENMNAVRINSESSSSSTSSASSSLSSPPPTSTAGHSLQQQQQQQQQHLIHHHQNSNQEEPQNLSRKPSPRGLIEGTTYHPSLKAQPSTTSSSSSSIAKGSVGSQQHSSSGSGTLGNGGSRDLARDSANTLYPGVDHSQPLHALVHAHFNHAHSRQHELHNQAQAVNGSGGGGGGGGNNNHPLMDSLFSTLKHNYLAAFEQAATAAMNGKLNGGHGTGGGGTGGGLSHSIKNIVMGGLEERTANGSGGGGCDRSNSSPANYAMNEGRSQQHGNYSDTSPGSSSKRRYSAPDNIYGDEGGVGGAAAATSIAGTRLDYEPPKKIASH